MATHTFRGILDPTPGVPMGSLTVGQTIRLQCDNASITDNFKVTRFEIYGAGRSDGFWNDAINPNVAYVTLALDEDGVTTAQNFGDNRQIGWAAAAGAQSIDNFHVVLDPDHLVVRDLWIGAYSINNLGTIEELPVPLQYLIKIETESTSSAQGIMGLIKERSQA